MATSLAQLLDTLVEIAQATEDGPVARADAATALGHLGRALHLLRGDGVSAAVGDRREQQVAALAAACTELGARAPATQAPLSPLAAVAADTIGILRDQGTVGGRWAVATALSDAVTPLAGLIAAGLHAGPAAQWLAETHRQAAAVQQTAALYPPSPADAVLLDHPLPFRAGVQAVDPAVVVPDATAVLVHATAATAEVASLAEILAYTVAAETLSDAAHALGGTAREESAVDPFTAADAWRAVRAALGPFDDGSRRPHRDVPPAVAAAGRLHAALRRAGPDASSWPASLRAEVAAAAQHLPTLAGQLDRTARTWGQTGALLAYACDLPAREDRVTHYLRGHRSGGVIRADIVDLRSVGDALDNARLLSTALAARAADPPVRRSAGFPRRAFAASRALLDQPETADALKKATEQANRHLQAARRRRAGPGRPR